MKIVVFKISDTWFGIDIMKVVEVLNYVTPQKIPNTPAFLEGVINFRNTIIPLLDFRKRLETQRLEFTPNTRIIIYKYYDDLLGLIVDEASEVVSFEEQDMMNRPEFIVNGANEYIESFLKQEDRMILILRYDEVLTTNERIQIADFQKSQEGNQ